MAQKNPCDTDIKNYDYKKDNTDTTITLKNGTQLTLNRCEFFDIRDCIEYREIRTLKDLQETGTTTMDNNGNVLSGNTTAQPMLLHHSNSSDIHHHEDVEESLSIMDKEKELIIKALKKHKGKRKDASLDLGISERTLYRKLKEYDIEE